MGASTGVVVCCEGPTGAFVACGSGDVVPAFCGGFVATAMGAFVVGVEMGALG